MVQVADPKPGDHLDCFLIEHLAPVGMICIITEGITHRWLGRVYMWPVGSAHRLIVWLMLRRLRRSMN